MTKKESDRMALFLFVYTTIVSDVTLRKKMYYLLACTYTLACLFRIYQFGVYLLQLMCIFAEITTVKEIEYICSLIH